MNSVIRVILASIVGILVGGLVIQGFELLSHQFLKFPRELYPISTKSFRANPELIPTGAFVSTLVAYIMGSILGGISGAMLYKAGKKQVAIVVGVVLMTLGVMAVMAYPHPIWFSIVSLFCFVPFTLLGAAAAPSFEED